MAYAGHVRLQCWLFSDADTRLLFHLVICKPPQALPSNEEGGKNKLSTEESKLQIHSMSRVFAVSHFLLSSEMLRGCFLSRDWLPCECLMLAQGLWALIMYSGNSWWASVIVWCAFSVIKRNDFPKPHIVFMVPVYSYPAVAWESHSVKKSEKMTLQKKNRGKWRC